MVMEHFENVLLILNAHAVIGLSEFHAHYESISLAYISISTSPFLEGVAPQQ